MTRKKILLITLLYTLTSILLVCGPMSPANAITRSQARFCNNHHTTMMSEYKETIHVYVDTQPDPAQASGKVSFGVGYFLCRVPGVGTFVQPRWIGACYKHTGILPSIVLEGIRTDYVGAVSAHRAHEVDNIFTETHPPIFKGNRYCEQKWFISRKWYTRAALYRWRVNYWEVTSGAHADQHHESPAIFLDPRNDRQLTPFRQVARVS